MEKPKITYQKHNWLDTKANEPKYGIDARVVYPTSRWSQCAHCAENGKPLIFDTEAERDAKLKELRRKQRVTQAA